MIRKGNVQNGSSSTAIKRGFFGRNWLLNDVQKRINQPDVRWLVVLGEPGIGKSAFARHFAEINAVHAAHYSKATAGGSLNPMSFVRSMSAQLAENVSEYSRFVLEGERLRKIVNKVHQDVGQVKDQGKVYGIYIENFLLETRDPQDAFQYLIREPLLRLDENVGLEENILLLVDGLDEAARYEQSPTILDLIRSAGDLPPKVRWLLTSRPGDHMGAFSANRLTIEDQSKDNLQDIRSFITHQLSNEELQVPGNNPELAQTLEKRSGGNFLYLDYVFEQLHRQAQKEGRLSPPEELPQGLDGVYREYFSRILKDSSRSEWRTLYRPVLGILTVSREPLGFNEIVKFSGAPPQDVQDALSDLGQIVEKTGSPAEPCHAIYHTSFSDFLTDRARNPTHWVDPVNAHREIVEQYWESPPEDWRECDTYGLHHLAAHMAAADLPAELSALLMDFGWLRAKLETLGASELIQDFSFLPENQASQLVEGALRLSAHTLIEDKSQLGSQLTGRLLGFDEPDIHALLRDAIVKMKNPWLRPLVPNLEAPGGPLLYTLTGHDSTVLDVDLTPDGRHAVSSSRDTTLIVWDLEAGRLKAVLQGHQNAVYAVRIAPDGHTIFSGGEDIILAWDLASEETLYTLENHSGSIRALDITPDGSRLLLLSYEGELILWDLENRTIQGKLTLSEQYTQAVAISPDGSRVLVSSGPDALLLDLEDLAPLKKLPVEGNANVRGIAWLPDGTRALVSSENWPVVLWDMETGEQIAVLEGHTAGVNRLAITRDGELALSASDDNTVMLFDLVIEKEIYKLRAHSDDVKAVKITTDGSRLITCSSDTTLKVWDIERLRSQQVSTRQHYWLQPDGVQALRETSSGQLELWDLQAFDKRARLDVTANKIQSTAYTPGGEQVLIVDTEGNLSSWDLKNSNPRAPLKSHPGAVRVAITPDGQLGLSAATSAHDGALRVWDLESGEAVHELKTDADWIGDLAVDSDSSRAVLIEYDAFQVWDLENRNRLIRLEKQSWEGDREVSGEKTYIFADSWGPWAAAVTPDARRVVFTLDDGSLRVFDVAELRDVFDHILSFQGIKTPWKSESPKRVNIESTAISARGNRIAVVYNNITQVFDVERGEAIASFRPQHHRPVTGVALSPEGRYVVTIAGETGQGKYGGRADTTLKVWEIGDTSMIQENGSLAYQTVQHLASFTGENNLLSCAFYGDGRTIHAGPHWLRLENFDAG